MTRRETKPSMITKCIQCGAEWPVDYEVKACSECDPGEVQFGIDLADENADTSIGKCLVNPKTCEEVVPKEWEGLLGCWPKVVPTKH